MDIIDWDSLEQRPSEHQNSNGGQITVPVKKVAIPKDKVRKLPDGTIVIREEDILGE